MRRPQCIIMILLSVGSWSSILGSTSRSRSTPCALKPRQVQFASHLLHWLVGLVVKAFALGMADLGFNFHFLHGEFSWSSDTSDAKIGTPVATLPCIWCYRVSAGTGWPGVSVSWLGEIANLICNLISVWQHIDLSEQIRPWDTLAFYCDVKQPTNSHLTLLHGSCSGQQICTPCLGDLAVRHPPQELFCCIMLQAIICYCSYVRCLWCVCMLLFIGIVQRSWACLTWKSAKEIKSLLLSLRATDPATKPSFPLQLFVGWVEPLDE